MMTSTLYAWSTKDTLLLVVLVPRRPRLTGIVCPDQPSLFLVIRLCLTKRKTSLSAHPLCSPNLLDGFLKSAPFSSVPHTYS